MRLSHHLRRSVVAVELCGIASRSQKSTPNPVSNAQFFEFQKRQRDLQLGIALWQATAEFKPISYRHITLYAINYFLSRLSVVCLITHFSFFVFSCLLCKVYVISYTNFCLSISFCYSRRAYFN